jgi:hypothetical protein
MKELLMSGSGTCWANFDLIYERTLWVLSQNACWVNFDQNCERTHWVISKIA